MSILCTHVVECIGKQIIHDNGGQLLMEEILSFINFLLLVVGYNKTSKWSNIDGHYSIPTSKWIMPYGQKQKQGFVKMKESYKDFFFVIIGNIFAHARSSICKDT
jgi:hypothetical protein